MEMVNVGDFEDKFHTHATDTFVTGLLRQRGMPEEIIRFESDDQGPTVQEYVTGVHHYLIETQCSYVKLNRAIHITYR